MKRFLIFIFIVLLALNGKCQERNIQIPWERNDSMIYFKDAVYLDGFGYTPIYSSVSPWSNMETIPVISSSVLKSSQLDEKYFLQIAKDKLKSSPETIYKLVFEKKRPMLQISFMPFFIDSVSGNIHRVDEFSIKTAEEKALATLKSQKKGQFASTSLLASNDWFKIAVNNTGIYRLSYEDLLEIGLQNPPSVKIFGAGALQLPEDYSKGAYDDLSEISFLMNKGSDHLFGPGDFILFYAQGPIKWSYNSGENFFSQEVQQFSDFGYYFITDDLGQFASPSNVDLSNDSPDFTVNSYDILDFKEDRKYNLLASGREWYGDKYSLSKSATYPFTLKNLILNETLKIRATVAGRSNEESYMLVKANGKELGNLTFSAVNLSSYTSTFAVESYEIFDYIPNQEVVTLQLEYLLPNTNSDAWLNHITLNGRARLVLSGDELKFRDSRSVSFGSISNFQLSNANSNTVIWDVTDPNKVLNIPINLNGNSANFSLETSVLREFVAFNKNGDFPKPLFDGPGLGKVKNQNLHGTIPPDMIIIYSEEFLDEVQRLASHRQDFDDLDVLIVTQNEIFNEFSSGTPNVSALRNYLKMYYDTYPPESMPKYLLLFGDGSYDNKDTVSENPNLILTYQSANSLVPTSSYVSDDFYGLLDTGEDIYDGLLDIGIGRLPVSTQEEAKILVDKIIAYDSTSTLGEWRNYICFIGDDEDGNIHAKQANSLADFIETEYPDYNINKVFLDAYPQETTPTGDRYPDVTKAINDQMNRGALIINYTGHGNINGLAHEKILDLTNIKSWSNEGKYPLFMTATCEFSRYDEYNFGKKIEITSAGEEVLLNPIGGGIALFTTTRLVYSGPNHVLNEKFYEIVFEKQENGEPYRLGDIIAYSKNNTGAGINKRNFTLLGDPAISLSFPKNRVITDSINHVKVEEMSDTISALDFITISGHIENPAGDLMESFNGNVIPIVYDKKSNLKTLANDGGFQFDFQSRSNILYKGNSSVKEGQFSFSFYVPKDIAYNVGEGKISYYCFSENEDGHGSNNKLIIGGIGDFNGIDTAGPSIKIYMNDSLFRNGGIVTKSPELLVYLEDPYGINTTGNGIGHDITATLNNDRINAVILNEYYQAAADSYSKGVVTYPYNDLPLGKHTIDVKVWDIFNNSASRSIDFIVVESAEMLLTEIYNYPNPFFDQTLFNVEHNRPDRELDVIIRIYDIQGNLVSVLQNHQYASGYRLEPIIWQGNSMGGASLGGGIYIYKVLVQTDEGEEAVGSGRMILKR